MGDGFFYDTAYIVTNNFKIFMVLLKKFTITMRAHRSTGGRFVSRAVSNNYGAAVCSSKSRSVHSSMFFVPAAQIKELDGLWLADRCPEYAWVARVVLPGLVWQDVSYGGESTRPAGALRLPSIRRCAVVQE
jgi:hypothetical protein